MTEQQLTDYIQKGRAAGMSQDEMRKDLLASGWNADTISVALGADTSESPNGGWKLTESESTYIHKWSWGGFFLTWIYFFATRHAKYGILFLLGSFVPVLNLVLAVIAGLRGRRFVWETGKWGDIETFKDRQRLMDKIGWIFAILSLIVFIGIVVSLTLVGLGDARRAVGP